MKKWMALLLTLVMLVSAASALAEALPEEADGALPQVGDVVFGFEAKEIRDFPLIGGQLVLFEHQQTGAKLLYAANEDTNRAFQLTFLTRPIDDTGLPHVFEHATLSGSDKYPSAALFMNMIAQTYNTYMNAYTTDAMTCFPVASLSEEQLLALADVYTDFCFHPLLLTDESIYRTEAWRYEMANADAPLTYNGTVYSEMTGALTLDGTALDNANRLTFPGAALSYDYGGIPDSIPDMTWDALKAYHEKFYHPSNCLVLLYGGFEDYGAFLQQLDGAFSAYERSDFHYEDSAYQRITEPVIAEVSYPMAAGTDPANQTAIYYYILCPGMKDDPAEEEAVDHLWNLLGQPSSQLMQKLQNLFPAGGFSVGRELAGPDDAVVFVASNLNRGDAEAFRGAVNDALKEIARDGFAPELVDSFMASINMSTKLSLENSDPIESVLYSTAYQYAVTGNPFGYPEYVDSLGKIAEESEQGLLQKTITDWLADPALYTLVSTYPLPGAKETHDAELAEKLAQIKEAMTDAEKQAIIDATNAENGKADASELLKQIKKVDTATMPEESKAYAVTDVTGINGVRRLDVEAAVADVCVPGLYFDAAALPQQDIHWMRLFTRLLGKLDTDAHTKEELDSLIARYLYSSTFGVSVSGFGNAYHPYLVAEWYAMAEDLQTGYDLVEEILYRTQFTDLEKLTDRIQAQKTAVRNQINQAPYNVLLTREMAISNDRQRYYSYLNYLEYYEFLEQVEALLAEDPQQVADSLIRVQQFFHNRAGAISTFAGNADSIAQNKALADAFWAKLDNEKREAAAYDLPVPAAKEGLVVSTNIQFNHVYAPLTVLGNERDGELQVLSTVVEDKVLMPVLRDQMGVYTPWCSVYNGEGLYLISYRDPNVRETFDVYAALADQLADMKLDQGEVDGYIMSVYSGLAKQPGELTGAVNEISRIISGEPAERKLEIMRQVKGVTPETIQAGAEVFRSLWEAGVRGTAGGIGAITENQDLYDVILNPFHVEDLANAALTDVPEDHPAYAAVRFAMENSLMGLRGDGVFGVDGDASVGDLSAALYVLVGGAPDAPEDGVALLQQYGIVPADVAVDTALTNGLNDQIMNAFAQLAMGAELPAMATEENSAAAMTRGELAQYLMLIFNDE
ncbi:MAG: insulinase family protein [Clostridia bacterium]|nr:insulinase family protein [Clostridia bacterium]